MQNIGRSTVRVVKNYTKGYSDTQTKVRDATSNDPWGPSGTLMNEIAQLTYNHQDFVEIMEMLDKRLNDKGKNWRHVFKSLTLLDYCLHAGDEKVVLYFQKNMYIIKTLKEFQYVDETGKDHGANVRLKAKDITNLLQDESRLRDERRSRAHMRSRMTGGLPSSSFDDSPSMRDTAPAPRPQMNPAQPAQDNEDAELRAAIEASKQSAQDDEARKRAEQDGERDLEEAMRLSREEEARRQREREDANQHALFDDGFQSDAPNAYANQNQDLLVDIGGPQNQQSLQPQFTAVPQQQYMQPQFTSMNPYQNPMNMQMTGNPYMQQQYTAFGMNPQQDEWNRQQEMLRMQQQQAQPQQVQQPLQPQATAIGSNNPFAQFGSPSTSEPTFSQSTPAAPSSSFANLNAPSPMSAFNAQPAADTSTPQATSPSPAKQPASNVRPTPFDTDSRHQLITNALQNRDDHGVDTFGNVGNLRYGTTNPFQTSQAQPSSQNVSSSTGTGQQQASTNAPFFSV